MTSKTIKWAKSISGGRFAWVRSCKLVELVSGGYLVERVTDQMPTSVVGYFDGLSEALRAIDDEPEAVCFRCGDRVVPGYQIPDPTLPCPTR